jgi:hypothetical protein
MEGALVQDGISGRCSTYGIKDLMGGGYERSARCKAGEYMVLSNVRSTACVVN